MSADIIPFQPRVISLSALPTRDVAVRTHDPRDVLPLQPSGIEGLAAIVANARAAVDLRTNRLKAGYRARLSIALSACAIAEWSAEKVLTDDGTVSTSDADLASAAADALDYAWSACLAAREEGLADRCSLAADRLLRRVQHPLWLRSLAV